MNGAISRAAPAWRCVFLALVAGLAAFPAPAAVQEPELLEPEKAFRISTRALDENNIEIRFAIVDGYYMYRDQFRFETAAGRLLTDAALPKGQVKEDPYFGRTETYRREVRIRVPVSAEDWNRGNVRLKVTSQGCADIGVCYVPLEQFVSIRLTRTAAPEGLSRWRSRATFWLGEMQRSVRSGIRTRSPVPAGSGALLVTLVAVFAFGFAAGIVRGASGPRVRRNLRVEVDLLRISLHLLTYTVGGTIAALAGALAFERLPDTLATAIAAAAFIGLAAAVWFMPQAAVTLATAGALLLVAIRGDALLGAAGLGLLSLAISLARHLAMRLSAAAAPHWPRLLLALVAGTLALLIASPAPAEPQNDVVHLKSAMPTAQGGNR